MVSYIGYVTDQGMSYIGYVTDQGMSYIGYVTLTTGCHILGM